MAAKKNTSLLGRGIANNKSTRKNSDLSTGSNIQYKTMNGYLLVIAPSGRVGVAFKNGKMYIPHIKCRDDIGVFWATCHESYTPDEIKNLIRNKSFRWIEYDKAYSSYGYAIRGGRKHIPWANSHSLYKGTFGGSSLRR